MSVWQYVSLAALPHQNSSRHLHHDRTVQQHVRPVTVRLSKTQRDDGLRTILAAAGEKQPVLRRGKGQNTVRSGTAFMNPARLLKHCKA